MKYNQPYDQPSNPNAPYVDGNPAAGIEGSIVPAASIEYPQRELLALISATGLTPTNSDLAQIVKALKIVDVFNVFKMAVNQGSSSQWSASIPSLPIMPPPAGTALFFKPNLPSVLGGTVFSLNGAAFNPVTLSDLTPISVGDVLPTAWLLLFFDGTQWQIVAGAGRSSGGGLTGPALQSNAHWYVNASTGNDTAYDGTQPTVSGTHGPFRTIQRAANETPKYNMNGFDHYIHVADGSYDEGHGVNVPHQNGSGYVRLIGNPAAPQNVAVSASGDFCSVFGFGNGNFSLDGFRLSNSGANAWDGIFTAEAGSHLVVINLRFGPCRRSYITCDFGAYIDFEGGTIWIEGGANCAGPGFLCQSSGTMSVNQYSSPITPVNILGPVSIGIFLESAFLAHAGLLFSSFTGSGFVSGQKYVVVNNAIINTQGSGVNYYPGSVAGAAGAGGLYL